MRRWLAPVADGCLLEVLGRHQHYRHNSRAPVLHTARPPGSSPTQPPVLRRDSGQLVCGRHDLGDLQQEEGSGRRADELLRASRSFRACPPPAEKLTPPEATAGDADRPEAPLPLPEHTHTHTAHLCGVAHLSLHHHLRKVVCSSTARQLGGRLVRCRPLARSERHSKSDSTASVAGKPTKRQVPDMGRGRLQRAAAQLMAPGCRHLSNVALAAVNNADHIQLGSPHRQVAALRTALGDESHHSVCGCICDLMSVLVAHKVHLGRVKHQQAAHVGVRHLRACKEGRGEEACGV